MLTTVLFDLDGTLLDTAPDLAYALNQLLQQQQRPPLPFTTIRPFASTGTRGLLQLAFRITEEHTDYPALKTAFLALYQQHITYSTTLFAGIMTVLNYLEAYNLRWAVVTNKATAFAQTLLAHFQLTARCSCLVGGDQVQQLKPAPDSLLLACQKMRVLPQECIYVGDTEIDILAAKSAGMSSVAALYGYHLPHDKPFSWQADYYINQASGLIEYLKNM